MPMFIAVHKWKPEDDITISKELIAGFSAKPPKDVILHYTWTRADYGAFCFWEAPSKEDLNKLFKQYLPTLLKYTEFVPVVQTYPPTMEAVLVLMQQLVKSASK